MTDKSQTTPEQSAYAANQAASLHLDLFGAARRGTPIGELEFKLINKYMQEVFEAGMMEGNCGECRS
jgi:hypothetical protein